MKRKSSRKFSKFNILVKLIIALGFAAIVWLIMTNYNNLKIPTSKQTKLKSDADALLFQYIKSKKLIGVSAGVLKGNEIVWQSGSGYLDIENKVTADSNMLHRIASITKPMTSVAIMQLVEKNILNLDVPIQNYLPDYQKKEEGEITIRHLLSHTAGTPAYKFFTSENRPTEHYDNLSEAIKVFKDRALLNAPGEDYHYSSYGYTVLGAIIETVTGLSYEAYMQKNIWSKCGMTNTSIEVFGDKYQNKSKLYKKNMLGFSLDENTNLSIKYPAGGVHSTVGDMLRFAKAFRENSLISEQSKQITFEIPEISKQLGQMYGLGWIMLDDETYGLIHFHDGHQSGTSSALINVPSKKMAVIVLANSSNSNDHTYKLAKELLDLHVRKN